MYIRRAVTLAVVLAGLVVLISWRPSLTGWAYLVVPIKDSRVDKLNAKLDTLGSYGWELAQSFQVGATNDRVLVFKRPAP